MRDGDSALAHRAEHRKAESAWPDAAKAASPFACGELCRRTPQARMLVQHLRDGYRPNAFSRENFLRSRTCGIGEGKKGKD